MPAASRGRHSLAGASGPRNRRPTLPREPLPHRLVEQRRRRRGHVERLDTPAHGQADETVAELAGTPAEALLLAAEAEDDLAREVDLPGRRAPLGGAVEPEALLLEAADRLTSVDDALHAHPLGGAGGGAADGRRDGRAAAVAQQHAADAGAVADAQQRAEVARVLHVLEQDDEVAVAGGAATGA